MILQKCMCILEDEKALDDLNIFVTISLHAISLSLSLSLVHSFIKDESRQNNIWACQLTGVWVGMT